MTARTTGPAWVSEPDTRPGRLLHVNATAVGGGVAEILHGLVPAQRADGVNAGWAVVGGNADFYAVTKYLHHLLHGKADPARLSDPDLSRTYRDVLVPQSAWFARQVGEGDVVVLHDPQTLGLAPALSATGARLLWHCHIGAARPSPGPEAAWRAFAEELSALDGVVTTRAEFAPSTVPSSRCFVVPPAIDPDAPKNRHLPPEEVTRLLDDIGLTARTGASRLAEVVQDGPLPAAARVVTQVSRWDPLKDMPGVLRCAEGLPEDVHLVLVGTDPTGIPDDPEGLEVFREVRRVWAAMSAADHRRVHLVKTAVSPAHESALVVNAVQRRSDVVLQKSFEEGFGLTVTEAMIKQRAVVAADVGGLRDQIVDGVNGLLVDPTDYGATRAALRKLLDDAALRRELGKRAGEDAVAQYTMARLVDDYRAVAALRQPGNTPSRRRIT